MVNPGGTNTVSVPGTNFAGTDPTPGVVDSIRFTGFPTNVTSITINGVTYTSGTFPVGGVTTGPNPTVLIDPIDGAVSAVIPFTVKDNAGFEDLTPASVTVPFTTISLTGTVYNDVDGLKDGNVDGIGIGAPAGSQLYAYLTAGAGTTILDSVPVAANGSYTFPSVAPNTQGINANIMSLGGIAIAIGAMVDAAVVMIENAHKRIEAWQHANPDQPLEGDEAGA